MCFFSYKVKIISIFHEGKKNSKDKDYRDIWQQKLEFLFLCTISWRISFWKRHSRCSPLMKQTIIFTQRTYRYRTKLSWNHYPIDVFYSLIHTYTLGKKTPRLINSTHQTLISFRHISKTKVQNIPDA